LEAVLIKRIAVLTSGGDAPGMNAAIRAVTRSAIDRSWEVFGVRNGFSGLIAGQFEPLSARSVGGIIQLGGTILGTTRCQELMKEDGLRKAINQLDQQKVDALIVIGGNGSQKGAHALLQLGHRVIGIACTIDNDLPDFDISIGVDTALNVALESIDRLRTTASSHQRAFLVEVMGRHCGYLALVTGIASGAEVVVIPEVETTPEQVAQGLRAAYDKGKSHAIAVVAEGARYNAEALVAYFREHQERIGFELRTTTLGHVQRGGAPTVADRLLASRLGAGAVTALADGKNGVLVGMRRGRLSLTLLSSAITTYKRIDPELVALAQILER